jgi:hypothetical protein
LLTLVYFCASPQTLNIKIEDFACAPLWSYLRTIGLPILPSTKQHRFGRLDWVSAQLSDNMDDMIALSSDA